MLALSVGGWHAARDTVASAVAEPGPTRPATPPIPTAKAASPTEGGPRILERQPCTLPDYDAFIAAEAPRIRDEMKRSGLLDELAREPVTAIYSRADMTALHAANRAGRCLRIVYPSGALRIVGHLMRPAGHGRHPTVLYARGGNAEFGKVDPYALLRLQQLVQRGYVVLATQYRGADGGDGQDEFGGRDVDDLMELARLARTLPFVDGDNLFLHGRSRGAMQAALALRRGIPVRAAVLVSGAYDLQAVLAQRPRMHRVFAARIPDFAEQPERELAKRSALRWPDELRVPVLIFHAHEDWRTPVASAIALARALAQIGHPHELVLFERDDHSITFRHKQMFQREADWLDQHRTPVDDNASPE